MEDWDPCASSEFWNETLDVLEPFLKKIGFKYIGDTFNYNGNDYKDLRAYQYYVTAPKRILGKIINYKYPIYFVFYDKMRYAFAINALYVTKSKYEVEIKKCGSYKHYEKPDDILNAAEFIHMYFTNEKEAKDFQEQLDNRNKTNYSIENDRHK